jgi:hypothetical protein
MLRSTFCALQVDAGRRLIWITPCKPQAQLGDMDNPPVYPNCVTVQPSRGCTAGVETERALSLPRAAPAACTGLSILDAFRRRSAMHKYIPCVTSVII